MAGYSGHVQYALFPKAWLSINYAVLHVCASRVRLMEQWLVKIMSLKPHACLSSCPDWWPNVTLYGQYKMNAWLWLTCAQGRCSNVLKKNKTRDVHQRVIYGWPLFEVMWMYVLLKQIYLTSNLHMSFILWTPLIILLWSLIKVVCFSAWAFACPYLCLSNHQFVVVNDF